MLRSIKPPSFSNRKRKRIPSQIGTSSESFDVSLPQNTINPLSHAPSTLKQLAVAGVPENEPLPNFHEFPHHSLPRDPVELKVAAPTPGDDAPFEEDDSEAEEAAEQTAAQEKKERGKKIKENVAAAVERKVGALHAVILRCLDAGEIERARSAFALLLRSKVNGRPIDVRMNHWWAAGAEILMRQGEEGRRAAGEKWERWGTRENAARVREYYEGLIRQYPFSIIHPRAAGAQVFWPAMVGVELYDVWVERKLALERAVEEYGEDVDGGGAGRMLDDYEDVENVKWERGGEMRARRDAVRASPLYEEKERIREEAARRMRELAQRMDDVMLDRPYRNNHEMLRLRGLVALFLGDLAMPTVPRTADEEAEGREGRAAQRKRAKARFRLVIKERGNLEQQYVDFARQLEDDDEEEWWLAGDEARGGADNEPQMSMWDVDLEPMEQFDVDMGEDVEQIDVVMGEDTGGGDIDN
jgi:hypothetical protein